MTRLSVNINKIASLRNARGGAVPDVVAMARLAVSAGAQGITVHPRPDLRHIRPDDVQALANAGLGVELNIEGNPFAPAKGAYPGLLAIAQAAKPAQITLVPDADAQLTSDHGFDFSGDLGPLAQLVAACKACGARVSLFVDPGAQHLERASEVGADRVEIYTGPYARAHAANDFEAALAAVVETAATAKRLGLGVNAGHDLDQRNLPALRAALGDELLEVSIGHALIADALVAGLAKTVQAYLELLR